LIARTKKLREKVMSDADRASFNRRSLLRAGAFAGLALAVTAAARRASGETTAPLKIGVIGSGHIGSTVGTLWVKSGHPVMFSSRHPEELASLAQDLGPLAKSGSVAEPIAFGDVIFIAVPYGAYPQIGKDYGSQLAGKVVLDAGNAVAPRDGEISAEAKGGHRHHVGKISAGRQDRAGLQYYELSLLRLGIQPRRRAHGDTARG
jgi:hypothetical protein